MTLKEDEGQGNCIAASKRIGEHHRGTNSRNKCDGPCVEQTLKEMQMKALIQRVQLKT